MPRPPMIRRATCVLVTAAALSGCGRTVAVEPLPMTSPGTEARCAALVSVLPEALSVGRSWPVAPDASTTAAWGSPPVVLRCGDGIPSPEPTDQLLEVDGTTWLVTPLTNGEQYASVGRTPGVIITVPRDYSPSASVLVELVNALAGDWA